MFLLLIVVVGRLDDVMYLLLEWLEHDKLQTMLN